MYYGKYLNLMVGYTHGMSDIVLLKETLSEKSTEHISYTLREICGQYSFPTCLHPVLVFIFLCSPHLSSLIASLKYFR